MYLLNAGVYTTGDFVTTTTSNQVFTFRDDKKWYLTSLTIRTSTDNISVYINKDYLTDETINPIIITAGDSLVIEDTMVRSITVVESGVSVQLLDTYK